MASYHSPTEWKDWPEWLAGRLDNRSRRLGYATYDGKRQQFTKSELVAFGSRIIAVVRALIGAGMSIFNDKAKLPNTEIPVRYIALDSSRPVGGTRCHGAFVSGSSDQLILQRQVAPNDVKNVVFRSAKERPFAERKTT